MLVLRASRQAIRRRTHRAVLAAVRRFELRLERYRLVRRDVIEAALMDDAVVRGAISEHARRHGEAEHTVERQVREYVDEIVPFFNVLSYYKVGYTAARLLLNVLYRVTCEYHDHEALDRIPRGDVVVYLANHRSNVDYVVLAYVLARGVSISYAVGEWARVWPLEYIFKSFGSYFIRRRYRVPLYHAVLERYVQLITRNGVTQGIFLEGGLSRDGALRPAKVGLLDYLCRTLRDPDFDRDIWLVPVAINYDRVLEDRTLIYELLDESIRAPRWRQAASAARYVSLNVLRLATRRLKRYGRAAVAFGTPLSLKAWERDHPGALAADKPERLPQIQRLADDVLARTAAIIPVTPVPLVAATLLSFGETVVDRSAFLDRLREYRDHLRRTGATVTHVDLPSDAIVDRAWKTLRMRRLLAGDAQTIVLFMGQRPLLEYYANSIKHLLPPPPNPDRAMHPAHDRDESLPGLSHPTG